MPAGYTREFLKRKLKVLRMPWLNNSTTPTLPTGWLTAPVKQPLTMSPPPGAGSDVVQHTSVKGMTVLPQPLPA